MVPQQYKNEICSINLKTSREKKKTILDRKANLRCRTSFYSRHHYINYIADVFKIISYFANHLYINAPL